MPNLPAPVRAADGRRIRIGMRTDLAATYLISAVWEATASHLPLRFTKTSVQT